MLIDTLNQRAITPVIPPKANRNVNFDCNFALYRERNLVERFFKHYRAIATRYDKLAQNVFATCLVGRGYDPAQLRTNHKPHRCNPGKYFAEGPT
jgi:hypothetical protein